MKATTGLLIAAGSLALAACAELAPSPPPAIDLPPRLTSAPTPAATPGAGTPGNRAQALSGAIVADSPWWNAFGDPAVDALVRQALAANPGLASAQASLRQARELAAAQSASLWPVVSASVGAVQAHGVNAPVINSAAPRSRMALVSASYSPDLFGLNRFGVQSAQAQADAARWQWAATRLSLEGAVLNGLVAEKAAQQQAALLDRLVDIDASTLAIVQAREALGDVSRAAVRAQEQQLHDRRAQRAAARLQAAQARDLLAALLGRAPGAFADPAIAFDALRLPDVPLALPGDILLRRPDVQFASAQLRATEAQRQAAFAARLPQLTLTGDAGDVAETVRHLLDPASFVWDLGAAATQTVFDGGAKRHEAAAARAANDAQAAQYRAAVVSAFQDVADDLEALQHDADAGVEAAARTEAARAQADIGASSRALGDLSRQDELALQAQLLAMQLQQVQARAARLVDTVNLLVALGVDGDDAAAPPAAGR